MPTPTPTLLIIEDYDLQSESYEEALSKYNLIRVSNGSEALAQIPKNRPDLLVLDHVLSEGELGLDFLPEFKELVPYVPAEGRVTVQEIAPRVWRARARYGFMERPDVPYLV